MLRYITEQSKAVQACKEIQEYLNVVKKPKLSVDLETYSRFGLKPRCIRRPDGSYEGDISLVQIGLNPKQIDTQYIFDVKKLGEEFLGPLLKPLLENTLIIGQNFAYDWIFLYKHLGIYCNKIRDTMLISQIINAGDMKKHGLYRLYRKFIPAMVFEAETKKTFTEYEEFKKRLQSSSWGDDELSQEQLEYAADDVRLTFFLYEGQLDELNKLIHQTNRPDIANVIKLECNLIPVVAMMEWRGVRFDKDRHLNYVKPFLRKVKSDCEAKIAEYFTKEVEEYDLEPRVVQSGKTAGSFRNFKVNKRIVTRGINLNSTWDIRKALEPSCGKLDSTDKEHLVQHVDKHPAIKFILQYKKAEKLLNTYTDSIIDKVHADGRIHAEYFQIGSAEGSVDTGRMSMANPNLMAQPSQGEFPGVQVVDLMRGSYIASEDCEIISADFGQYEARIMASKAKDSTLIDIFKNELDIYAITAQKTQKLDYVPDKNVSDKQKFERDKGKKTFLSYQYGAGAMRYHLDALKDSDGDLFIPIEECIEIRKNFFEVYDGLADYIQTIKNRIDACFDGVSSLAEFKFRPIYIGFTDFGRPRKWMLTPKQLEKALKPKDSDDYKSLHRNYQVFDEKRGEWTTWGNEFNARKHAIFREAVNQPIQGLVSDTTKLSMVEIHNKLREAGLPDEEGLILQVHDEIDLEVKKINVEKVKDICYTSMSRIAQPFLKKVKVKVSMGSGASWAEAK